MLKRVKIHIRSERHGVAVELFEAVSEGVDDEAAELAPWMGGMPADALEQPEQTDEEEQLEVFCEGRLRVREDVFSLTYRESDMTEMEDATTTLSFHVATPGLISMLRCGDVSTSMVFEEGKRHTCVYRTPYMTFEICVHTLQVENQLRVNGTLFLDYVVEIRGAQAERCRLRLQVTEP